MKTEISREKNECEFLSIWQKIMSSSLQSVDKLTQDAFDAFSHHYNVDGIIFIRLSDNSPQVFYTGEINIDLIYQNISDISHFFTNSKNEFIVNSTDRNYQEYQKIFELYGCDKVYSAFGTPFYKNDKLQYIIFAFKPLNSVNIALSSVVYHTIVSNKLNVYVRLFRQMIDTIDRIENIITIKEINKQLEYSAQTDILTGLLNRVGLYEKIKSLLLDMDIDTQYTIVYIDLDNFKYYNDTFGHEIGDIVLKEFSIILRDICKNLGIAIRYGGDEFIVMFENITEQLLKSNIEDINKTIKSKSYFLDIFSKELDKDIIINEEYKLSCSIGICNVNIAQNSTISTFEKAISKADKALYDVKRTSKGSYKYYNL